MQYLKMVRKIIDSGSTRLDRTKTGIYSCFGQTMKFNLRNNQFPLLTTKKMFLKGVVEELLWFISGSTNAKILNSKNVKIWDSNASRKYLDSIGLTNHEEGDLGPIYSFQWRHFGASYQNMHTDYSGQGVDQLKTVIDLIKNDPYSRRILLSSWNPVDLPRQALPPCHVLCQFYVSDGELSCQMYQRSGDLGLGVPFNVASYALLTKMIAHVCNLKCGDFFYVLGDAHVYKNHVQALEIQLSRTPKMFPQLIIKDDHQDIDQFKFEHFNLLNYECHDKIEMEMSV